MDALLQNDLLTAIIAFAIVLIPAVLIHELGHFLAGKAVGITILEFGIGFPPRIARLFTWRETEFTLNMVPLGGFVRPLGEDLVGPSRDESAVERDKQTVAERTGNGNKEQETYEDDLEELRARGVTNPTAVNDVAPVPRIFFLSAGALANFVFAFLMFVLIGLTGVPQMVGVRIGLVEVGEDTALAQAGLQANDYIERLNGEYFISADAFFERMEALEGQDVTLQVRRIDPEGIEPDEVFNLEVPAFVAPELPEGIGNGYVYVTAVDEDSPGESAGLEVGDLIVSVDGERVSNDVNPVLRLQELVDINAGTEIEMTILRDGEQLEVALTPRENPPDGRGRIGIQIGGQAVFVGEGESFSFVQPLQLVPVGLPVGEAIEYGAQEFTGIMRTIAEFPARLLQGNTQPEERRIISVVGISQIGGEILRDSVQAEESTPLVNYIALISIALGFTNLLPIPALDGGRILFVIIEMVRGKPMSPESEGIIHLVGLIFLLSIGVFFIINDLMNPLTDIIP
jgi:regulator of sigma E protease